MNGSHCSNLSGDRNIGKLWEENFCKIAAGFGLIFTAHQIGRDQSAKAITKDSDGKFVNFILPDVSIWNNKCQHHEIKHKNPTPNGMFGLEQYRFDSLMKFTEQANQSVYYTIHNHDLAGGREVVDNCIDHWVTAKIETLNFKWSYERSGPSWRNGNKVDVNIYYWNKKLFTPLSDLFNNTKEESILNRDDIKSSLEEKDSEINDLKSKIEFEREKRNALVEEIRRFVTGKNVVRQNRITTHDQSSLF